MQFLPLVLIASAQAVVLDLEGVTEGLNDDDLSLDYATVARIASLPLHCHSVEYPNKLSQVLDGDADLLPPRELHPIFYGCFDWHSSVHGHWLLARALAMFPGTELANNITTVFDEQFTEEKITKEVEYFQKEPSYERTYGWAWLLKLQEELERSEAEAGPAWAEVLRPLTQGIVSLWTEFQPKLVYPLRVGQHTNTAFGLSLAIDYARTIGDTSFEDLIKHNSSVFFLVDEACPLNYEPSGSDFLSPCLQEVDLMVKVVEAEDNQFNDWVRRFLPQLFEDDFELEPGQVIDRTDGKLVHLDGLNFSRAWCLYNLARRLASMDQGLEEVAARLIRTGDTHIRASMENVVGSDYAGSHWLATFLMYALETRAATVASL